MTDPFIHDQEQDLLPPELRQRLQVVAPPPALHARLMAAAAAPLQARRRGWRRQALSSLAAGVLGFVSFFAIQAVILDQQEPAPLATPMASGELPSRGTVNRWRAMLPPLGDDTTPEEAWQTLATWQGEAQ